jgi:hypothetical protein
MQEGFKNDKENARLPNHWAEMWEHLEKYKC